MYIVFQIVEKTRITLWKEENEGERQYPIWRLDKNRNGVDIKEIRIPARYVSRNRENSMERHFHVKSMK